MILQKIELKNFMCYAGLNEFNFTEGINVIIGDNGYGKSKLYDAFWWVMYNQCFDTSVKKFRTTNLLKRQIVSDKAIDESDNGTITASVILTFHNTEKDSLYILERRYNVRKKDEEIVEDQDSEEIIWYKEMSYMNAKEIKDAEQIERIKKTILPDNIKPYMWFQGEQVESIIDFNQTDTLTKAINVLSNITRFDNIIAVADGLKETTTKEFNKKQRDLSGDKNKSESLEVDRQEILRRLNGLQLQDVQIKDNKALAEEKAEGLLNKHAEAQKIKEIEVKRKGIEKNLQEIQDEFNEEQKNLHKRMFTNKWVLKGTEDLFKSYGQMYEKYEHHKMLKEARIEAKIESEREIIKEFQARLPIDVPEPIHVERMLREEKCLVCDRPAPEGSDAWLAMKALIDRSETKISILEDDGGVQANNFSGDFKKLYQNGLGGKSTQIDPRSPLKSDPLSPEQTDPLWPA